MRPVIGDWCLWRNGRIRWISSRDMLINKNTPRGDPPNYYERKPYGGRRLLPEKEILGQIDSKGLFEIFDCNMTIARWNKIKGLNIPISFKLFYNGKLYTDRLRPFKGYSRNDQTVRSTKTRTVRKKEN